MLSIYDSFGYGPPDQERYRLIRRVGFEGVLVWWSDGFGRGAGYRDAPGQARKAGLVVENIHAPVQQQDDLGKDNLEGDAVAACYLQCVADCAALDIPTVVIHLPNDRFPLGELGLKRLLRLYEEAERLGVQVAFENLFNLNNLALALEAAATPRIGFCYDACHHANNPLSEDLLGKYGQRLMALHLHDNGGERHQHQLPFDGPMDWKAIMGQIAQTGYRGPTALEPMNWGYEAMAVEDYLHRAYESALRLDALRRGV